MSVNKVTMAVAAVLFVTASMSTPKAYAISAGYRAQLERSGCTQVSESQGCRLDKSKAWNEKHGFIETEMKEGQSEHPWNSPNHITTSADSWKARHAKETSFIEEEVLGAMGMEARQKLLLAGWSRPDLNIDRWIKDEFVLTLETNKAGRVISGDLK